MDRQQTDGRTGEVAMVKVILLDSDGYAFFAQLAAEPRPYHGMLVKIPIFGLCSVEAVYD